MFLTMDKLISSDKKLFDWKELKTFEYQKPFSA